MNENEEKHLKEAAINAISYWPRTEKKHTEPETQILQKIIANELWLKEKELDHLLFNQLNSRLMLNNNKSLILKEAKILKLPSINYTLSNAPYHEIIDTSIAIENTDTNKQKYIKYERLIKITKQLTIGKEIASLLLDMKQNQITIPDFKDNNNIEEEMTTLEAQIQIYIEKINDIKKQEAEKLLNELINIIPQKIKEKEINKLKDIEYDKLRDVHNQYRDIVSKLDTKKARVLEIAHEMIERITESPKTKTKLRIGRPPKIKDWGLNNNKKIEEYFVKQN